MNDKKGKNMLKSYFVKIVISILIISGLSAVSFFGYEQYKIYDFQKRYKEAPIGSVIQTGNMKLPRSNHSCIRLKNGKVLIIGGNKGIEMFDPKTGQYSIVSNKTENINGALQNSILLPDGNVFIFGKYIYNQNTNKIKEIKNSNEYIQNKPLDEIYPIVISTTSVLVIYTSKISRSIKFYIYDINSNSYNDYNINLPTRVKSLLQSNLKFIKDDKDIFFITGSGSNVIKWNYIENKFEDIQYLERFQQCFILDNYNILLNSPISTQILNIKSMKTLTLKALSKEIYTILKNNSEYFIFACNKNSNEQKLELYKLNSNAYFEKVLDLQNFYQNRFEDVDNTQSIVMLNNNNILLTGGKVGMSNNSKVKISRIIKLGE